MTVKTQAKLLALHSMMRKEFPEFDILEKRVWYWWLLYYVSFMFLWNRSFMKTTWTTIGQKVYIPYSATFFDASRSEAEMKGDYATLWHEKRHIRDQLDLGVPEPLRGLVWSAGYLFPQILALGALGAFWTPWAWFCLGFLAPWPAPFRVWVEKRGYMASAGAWLVLSKGTWEPTVHDPWVQKIISKAFLGWSYYRMSWSRSNIEDFFRVELANLVRDYHAN